MMNDLVVVLDLMTDIDIDIIGHDLEAANADIAKVPSSAIFEGPVKNKKGDVASQQFYAYITGRYLGVCVS